MLTVLDQGVNLEALSQDSVYAALQQTGNRAGADGSEDRPIPLQVDYVLWGKSKRKVRHPFFA